MSTTNSNQGNNMSFGPDYEEDLMAKSTIQIGRETNLTNQLRTSRHVLDSKIKQLNTVIFGIFFFVCALEQDINIIVKIGGIAALVGILLLIFYEWLNKPNIQDTSETHGNEKESKKLKVIQILIAICVIVALGMCILSLWCFEPVDSRDYSYFCQLFPNIPICR